MPKILKYILFLPSMIIVIPYGIYILIKVFNNTNIVDLEIMGAESIAKEIVEKHLDPLFNRNYLRFISILTWITLIFKLYV